MSFSPTGSLLFSPCSIRDLRLENRIVLPAMVTRLSGADGFVNDHIRARYLRFARGEPGLMVLEAMGVNETRSGPLLRASHDRFVPGLRDLVREIRRSMLRWVLPSERRRCETEITSILTSST